MDIVFNILLSAVSLVIALIAVFQTQKQIRLSNRQHLFDRRLEKYMVIKDLLSLFSKNREHIVDKKDLAQCLDLQFSWLTNVTYLSDMIFAIKEPLQSDKQNIFLSKCEMLEKYSIEINILWNDETVKIFSLFIKTYKEMLFKMYQQQVCIDSLRKFNEEQNGVIELKIDLDTFNERAMKNANNICLFAKIKELDSIYKKIIDEKLEQELIETLKL